MVNFLRIASSVVALTATLTSAAPVPSSTTSSSCPSVSALSSEINSTLGGLSSSIGAAVKDISELVNESLTHSYNSSATITSDLINVLQSGVNEVSALESTISSISGQCLVDDVASALLPKLSPLLGLVDVLANLLLGGSLSSLENQIGSNVSKVLNLVDQIISAALGIVKDVQNVSSTITPEIQAAVNIIEGLANQIHSIKWTKN